MSHSRLRIGIVGAGLMGRWHGHAAEHAGAFVGAVYDADHERAMALAARHRGSRACASLREALDLVDIAQVTTPTDSHASLASEALKAGRHVLVEKPFTSTVSEAESLLQSAQSSGKLICPVHQFLFQDGMRRVLNQLERLGTLHHIEISVCSAGADGRDAIARDVTAVEIMPHALSLIARLTSSPLETLRWSLRHPEPGEIRALAQSVATTVLINVSMGGRPTANRIRLVGARATAHVDFFHGFSVIQGGEPSRARKVRQPFADAASGALAATTNLLRRAGRREPAYPGLRTLLSEFYAAVRNGGPSPIPPGEVLAVARAYGQLRSALVDINSTL